MYCIADALAPDLPNLKSVLKEYGITMEDGIVVEGDSNYYMQVQTYLLPTIGYSTVTSKLQNKNILVPISKGFTHGEDTDEYTITSLLSTSDAAYSKIDTESNVIEKEDADIDGPFDLSLQVDTEEGGKLIVLGSVNLLEEQIDSAVSGTNSDFILNGINYLAQQESKISVRAKTLTTNQVTMSTFSQKALMVGTTFVLPAFVLLAGFIIVLRRRRK